MGEFYEHPKTGKLHFRAPAGGGNSVYDGIASEADIRHHADDYGRYHARKRQLAEEAKGAADLKAQQDAAARAEAAAIAALKTENAAMAEQIAVIETHKQES